MQPEGINMAAFRLTENPKITLRLEELRKPAIEKAQMTLETHLADLKELRDLARDNNQLAAAITAEVARGKAAGVAVDKSEVKHSGAIGQPELNIYVNGAKSGSDTSSTTV